MSHGTRAHYVAAGCRCRPCRDANTAYENHRAKQIAYGQWTPYRPAGITRQRIDWLRREGLGLTTIAELVGTHRSVLQKIARGETRQVRVETQNAVMAIEPTLDLLAPSTLIDAGPVWEQVRDLLDAGFTKAELGRWITRNPNCGSLQLHRGRVTARNARAVADLHDRWRHGQIVPAKHQRSERPVERATCEDCDQPSLGGGRWCLPCFQQQRKTA